METSKDIEEISMSEGESSMPSLDDILGVDAVDVAAPTPVPTKKRGGKSSATDIEKVTKDAIDSVVAKQSEADSKDPYAIISSMMSQPPETDMATWAIEILCNASLAVRYRQIFRAAAEQVGEMGVYRLLRVMILNTHHLKHNQLWMAACPSIASARIAGKGISLPTGVPLASADIMCRMVLDQAKSENVEIERVRRYGSVRIS